MTWDASRFASLDFETHLIERGRLAPNIVCASTADGSGARLHFPRREAVRAAVELLESDKIICGANIVFDFGCLARAEPAALKLIFDAYRDGRVFDVQIAQALDAVAGGHLGVDPQTGGPLTNPVTGKTSKRYSLDICTWLTLGRTNAKANDYWRMRYALLEALPLAEWPEDARQYPLDDAVNTLEVARAQCGVSPAGAPVTPLRNLEGVAETCEAAWALHLGAMWSMRTDRERVEALREKTELEHALFVDKFRELGFIKDGGKVDKRAVKRAVVVAYAGGAEPCGECVAGKTISAKTGNPVNCKACDGTGLDIGGVPSTPGGGVSADRDTLAESGDETLMALAENEPEKVLETYLPFLETGLTRPIDLRPNVVLASLRTSYDGLIQLLPREGDVRPCFRARPGYLYCSVDYSAAELCTLAQMCLWIVGWSDMAETINASGDPGALHTAFASSMAGIDVNEFAAQLKSHNVDAKKLRQAAKAANFGFPGGMGAAKLVIAKRKKSEGFTESPEGPTVYRGKRGYYGIRFCILLGGATRCGDVKVTEWKHRPIPPTCKHCIEVAERELRPAWFRKWREIQRYFDWVTDRAEHSGEFPCLPSDLIRGGCDFSSGANNGFQFMAAWAGKRAFADLSRECYLGVYPEDHPLAGQESPLAGSRPLFFAHDEAFAELVRGQASEAGFRMAEVMRHGFSKVVPQVSNKAEPALMEFWYKGAEPVIVDGKLLPWEPEE